MKKIITTVLIPFILAGCKISQNKSVEYPFSSVARLGALAFSDPSLSATGKQSCASCHAPEYGHAAPNDLSVQLGGNDGTIAGLRNSQPLRYLATNTDFKLDERGRPSGGFFWDGRANSLVQQAAGPLLGAREMANPDKAAVVEKISRATWVEKFKEEFGPYILENVDLAFEKLTKAIAQFQMEDLQFNGFTSKYDAVLRGQSILSAQEKNGLMLFNNPNKGNCAACHTSTKSEDGRHPLFTDFSYDNLGVPRNADIPENTLTNYYDLGLCGRIELRDRTDLCGYFKVPSLRNVVLRKSFFHNGKFKSLRDVLTFYVERDIYPEKWYSKDSDGMVQKFDDLPLKWHENVNRSEAPYKNQLGNSPALNPSEIDDLLKFLETLTDGWQLK